uniref:Uncharacterized protein n=1 Tax=Triticum urartu TaxID=4572 RepID=A0A8R7QN35_TRIUA
MRQGLPAPSTAGRRGRRTGGCRARGGCGCTARRWGPWRTGRSTPAAPSGCRSTRRSAWPRSGSPTRTPPAAMPGTPRAPRPAPPPAPPAPASAPPPPAASPCPPWLTLSLLQVCPCV